MLHVVHTFDVHNQKNTSPCTGYSSKVLTADGQQLAKLLMARRPLTALEESSKRRGKGKVKSGTAQCFKQQVLCSYCSIARLWMCTLCWHQEVFRIQLWIAWRMKQLSRLWSGIHEWPTFPFLWWCPCIEWEWDHFSNWWQLIISLWNSWPCKLVECTTNSSPVSKDLIALQNND